MCCARGLAEHWMVRLLVVSGATLPGCGDSEAEGRQAGESGVGATAAQEDSTTAGTGAGSGSDGTGSDATAGAASGGANTSLTTTVGSSGAAGAATGGTGGVASSDAPGARALALTDSGSCALAENGSIHCWGLEPEIWNVPAGSFEELYSADAIVCARRADKTVTCFTEAGSEVDVSHAPEDPVQA